MKNNQVEVKEVGGNGHKSNWLTILKDHLADLKGTGWTNENLTTIDSLIDAVKAVTDLLPNGGALSDLATILADTAELQADWVNGGRLDLLIDSIVTYVDLIDDVTNGLAAIKAEVEGLAGAAMRGTDSAATAVNLATVDTVVDAIKAVTDLLPNAGALSDLATILTAIQHGTYGLSALDTELATIREKATGPAWNQDTDSLEAIRNAIDTIAGVNSYQEQIPDTDFALAAIDVTLTADPPSADAENSVVDIDAIGGSTFALRSLFVNVTSFGTGTKLTFKLWVPINGVITEVDSVDITATGIQNLVDIFGLQEVHADSIHITVQTDVGIAGACSGTWKYAKAS